MKVIESDKIVPLCRLLMYGIPSGLADTMCKDIQDVVDMHSFEVAPLAQHPTENRPASYASVPFDRAIEILDPEHREHYFNFDPVNEACRMGMNALYAQREAAKLISTMHNKKATLWMEKYGGTEDRDGKSDTAS